MADHSVRNSGRKASELPYVQKRSFSNVTRLLCFAGLEGTGHHYFHSVFHSSGSILPMNHRNWPDSLGVLRFRGSWEQFGMESQNRDWRSGKLGGPQPHGWMRKDLERNRKYVEQTAAKLGEEKLLVVEPMITSWPNCHGSHKERMMQCQPSLPLLAEMAEKAGMDLRIILMSRNAEEVLAANCLHRRDLESCEMLPETYATNAEELRRQLLSLDPAFYRGGCTRYGDINGTSRALSSILAGTRFSSHDEILGKLREGWRNKHRSKDDLKRMSKHVSDDLKAAIYLLGGVCKEALKAGGVAAVDGPAASETSTSTSLDKPAALETRVGEWTSKVAASASRASATLRAPYRRRDDMPRSPLLPAAITGISGSALCFAVCMTPACRRRLHTGKRLDPEEASSSKKSSQPIGSGTARARRDMEVICEEETEDLL